MAGTLAHSSRSRQRLLAPAAAGVTGSPRNHGHVAGGGALVEARHKERCLARAGRLIIVRDGRRACRIGEEEPMRAAITASGHHVPDDVYPNSYFEGRLDTTDEWIRSRT